MKYVTFLVKFTTSPLEDHRRDRRGVFHLKGGCGTLNRDGKWIPSIYNIMGWSFDGTVMANVLVKNGFGKEQHKILMNQKASYMQEIVARRRIQKIHAGLFLELIGRLPVLLSSDD